MDATEITKVIDGVYKNILDNFNPASRQMINTGKAYLKSLHGASAASSLYLDTLMRLSRQAQQSTLGNSGDVGTCLMQITEVFKEIHAQQLNTLKAFYVDFLVPLETNLEKDTRVIQTEQKKFLMCHKQRMESYNKAASTVKKMRKKSKKSNPSAQTLDKEIKVMQAMEEERSKLEAFCDKSIKDALTQERRRYGFILERQASLAKHYLAFFSKGNSLLNVKLENWMKVAKTREVLPESMQNQLLKRIQGGDEENCIYCSPRKPGVGNSADDTASISSQLRKTKSMDATEIINLQSDQTELPVTSGAGSMSRAKSELNLMMNGGGGGSGNVIGSGFGKEKMDGAGHAKTMTRPKSLAVASETTTNGYAKALYAYLSSGDNQLSFLEGDIIALIGDKNKGWQYGENLRTQKTGWFPVAYTELDMNTPNSGGGDLHLKSATLPASSGSSSCNNQGGSNTCGSSPVPPPMPVAVPLPPSVVTMNNVNAQQSMMTRENRMMMSGHGGHGHGTYSPTSSSNSSSSTFHQKRLNLADVIVHRTPESMMSMMGSQPTTPSAINNKSLTSPMSPMGPPGGAINNNLIVPGGRERGAGGAGHGAGGNVASGGARQHGHTSTTACASDSLHSSNDSGFSNDLTNPGSRGAGVVPPPQPDVDYSDDEPQLSNRRKIVEGDKTPPQSGDRWLMERYHMSESIRIGGLGIGGITRRRSLSFSNVSGVGVTPPVRSNTRGAHDYGTNGPSNFPRHAAQVSHRPDGHPLDYRRPDLHLSYDKEGSGLKKLLNRTKSLIWRRQPSSDRFDSISVAGSTGSLELWGSHASLIETSYDVFEMKELSPSAKNHHYDDDVTIKDENMEDEIEEEVKMVKKERSHDKGRSSSKGPIGKAVPPPLPPFPANLRGLHGLNVKPAVNTANNKATSTTESLNNVSLPGSPEPMDNDGMDGSTIIGARDSDSCIFISDHMKCKGSQRSLGHKSTKSSIITERHSKKIQADLMDDEEEQPTHDTLPKKGHHQRKHHHHHQQQQQVSRVESFSGSEAPIIPVESGKNGKKKPTLSSTSGTLQGNHSGHKNNSNSSSNNGRAPVAKVRTNGSSVNGTNGRKGPISRSYLAQEHSRKFSYNSDEEEVDVDDYGVDEDVIDFDEEENDHYGDSIAEVDNVSSVFMEPEPEQEEIEALPTEMKAPQSLPPIMQTLSTPTASVRSGSQQGRASHTSNAHNDFSNGFLSKSSRDSSSNGHHSNTNGHYEHSGRFAPIVPYNLKGNNNNNAQHNGKGTGRMNSPAPQPPPPPSAPHAKAAPSSSSTQERRRHNNTSEKGSQRRAEKQRSHNHDGSCSTKGGRSHSSRPTTIKGSIRSEFHTVELIATTDDAPAPSKTRGSGSSRGEKPIFDYGSQIHRRLYCPERNSRLDQKSERSGNLCGPCYGADKHFIENQYPTLRVRGRRHRERDDEHDRCDRL